MFPSQLEDPASVAVLSSLHKTPKIPQTLTEKIVQRYSVGLPEDKVVKTGDFVTLSPHAILSHDNTYPISLKFMSMGASKIQNNRQAVFALDHDVQNKSESNLKKYRLIEEFAKQQGVDFYPAGSGIGHQIMIEEGYAFPGTLSVASDSHATSYGGLGSLGVAVVRTDAASIWATQRTWWQVPPVARVNLIGSLPPGVTGKDVIVALCGVFGKDEVLNHAIEFVGSEETMRGLPVDSRITIANMTTEWGALSGLFPIDNVLQNWLRYKATQAALYQTGELSNALTFQRFSHQRVDQLFANPLTADKGAQYAKNLYLDLSSLSPYVSGPNSVKIATPLAELAPQNLKIDKAYLLSCTNARASDFAAAAQVFKDAAKANNGQVPKVAPGVKFYVAAASHAEQLAAEEAGDWQVMLDAGAETFAPGCHACIGLGQGTLEPGEVGVSSSNRNFKGRMGSVKAKAYLASPEVVAASALHGKIIGPDRYQTPDGWAGVISGEGDGIPEGERMVTVEEALEKITGQLDQMIDQGEKTLTPHSGGEFKAENASVGILDGFPEQISGEIVFCDADNISTDGIYPSTLTYVDDVTTEKMADACMSNYDADFASTAKAGDILVAGFNFGCGSSREQAATSILAKQIPLVIGGSFSNIFQRNAINNALVGIEVPKLVQRLREKFSSSPSATVEKTITEPEMNKESLDSPPPAPTSMPLREKQLTRRTGWKLTWDVRKSRVIVQEGPGGPEWSQKVGELPSNVQEIIAAGGLERWVQTQISVAT